MRKYIHFQNIELYLSIFGYFFLSNQFKFLTKKNRLKKRKPGAVCAFCQLLDQFFFLQKSTKNLSIPLKNQ